MFSNVVRNFAAFTDNIQKRNLFLFREALYIIETPSLKPRQPETLEALCEHIGCIFRVAS